MIFVAVEKQTILVGDNRLLEELEATPLCPFFVIAARVVQFGKRRMRVRQKKGENRRTLIGALFVVSRVPHQGTHGGLFFFFGTLTVQQLLQKGV